MEKERVLVRDNKGVFLKMFKRRFKDEFDFFENPFLYKNENEGTEFDRSIFVVYDKYELVEFLQLNKRGSNVLVCLFNKQLYDSLSFLEEVRSLILLDSSKTRFEIIKELKLYFNGKPDDLPETPKINFQISDIISVKSNDFYKALFSLM